MRLLDKTLFKPLVLSLSAALAASVFISLIGIQSICAQELDAADIFSSKCSGCHTIGKGAGVGPDLSPTKDWTDQKLLDAVKKMAPMSGGLTESQISALVSYLKNPTPPTKNSSETPTDGPAEETAEEEIELPGSSAEGELLFKGLKPLENGGMSCISCHQSGNTGGLGPDLKGISKKYKPRALVQACRQAPFKVMLAAYKSHPISESEALNLAKYLTDSDQNSEENKSAPIPLLGGAFAIAVLAIIAIGYRNRNKNVRDKLKRK